jgi:hypothetical protein
MTALFFVLRCRKTAPQLSAFPDAVAFRRQMRDHF